MNHFVELLVEALELIVAVRDLALQVRDLAKLLAARLVQLLVEDIGEQLIGCEIRDPDLLGVDALLDNRELRGLAPFHVDLEAVGVGGFFGCLHVDQFVVGACRMLDNHGLRFRVYVANREGLRLLQRSAKRQDAPAVVELSQQLVRAVKCRRDARSQVDGVADQTLVTRLDRFHQRFSGIRAGVVDRNRAPVHRRAAGVVQLRRVERVLRAVGVVVDQKPPGLDTFAQERQHGGLALANRYRLFNLVLEQFAKFRSHRGRRDRRRHFIAYEPAPCHRRTRGLSDALTVRTVTHHEAQPCGFREFLLRSPAQGQGHGLIRGETVVPPFLAGRLGKLRFFAFNDSAVYGRPPSAVLGELHHRTAQIARLVKLADERYGQPRNQRHTYVGPVLARGVVDNSPAFEQRFIAAEDQPIAALPNRSRDNVANSDLTLTATGLNRHSALVQAAGPREDLQVIPELRLQL